MVIIGLTGGIGSGKSYVASLLSLRGIRVYDSDFNAKRIISSDADVVSKLTEIVGPSLYSDGVLDRSVMARFIFGNKDHAREVEAVIHPKVKEDFREWTGRLENTGICALESAILFESGFNLEVDLTVAVYAPLELRIERCMLRDGTDRKSVLSRIMSQGNQEMILSKCGFVIINDGTRGLQEQIDELIEKCKDIEFQMNRRC
ncbi:MAG: dephospho-CoA kinase [Bacteroidaceae bacterium]|nr:dephospho-CoA kinase [Bacteroidaceae bacterium]